MKNLGLSSVFDLVTSGVLLVEAVMNPTAVAVREEEEESSSGDLWYAKAIANAQALAGFTYITSPPPPQIWEE